MSEFVNKVAESGMITLNLEEFYPKEPVVVFDMKDYLFMGLILKEKDFRESLKQLDTTTYEKKIVALTCTADAVIPMWAYMLVASLLQPVAKEIIFGSEEEVVQQLLKKNIADLGVERFIDQRVVVKGCGDLPVAESAYIEITKKLRPAAKSIMYGEPCSTVPVFKKPITRSA
ncbi:MAG: DUF2480 family protein [Ferruginibacter sp.]